MQCGGYQVVPAPLGRGTGMGMGTGCFLEGQLVKPKPLLKLAPHPHIRMQLWYSAVVGSGGLWRAQHWAVLQHRPASPAPRSQPGWNQVSQADCGSHFTVAFCSGCQAEGPLVGTLLTSLLG